MSKVFVCYVNHDFVYREIQTVFSTAEQAQKWMDDTNKQIDQINGLKHAAETRYKDKDQDKYDDVLRQATAFEKKTNLPHNSWLANYMSYELIK